LDTFSYPPHFGSLYDQPVVSETDLEDLLHDGVSRTPEAQARIKRNERFIIFNVFMVFNLTATMVYLFLQNVIFEKKSNKSKKPFLN